MRLAQTNREVPKYGASRREAESSIAREHAPATKTRSIRSQPCKLEPAVATTRSLSIGVVLGLGVFVDIGNSLSFHIDARLLLSHICRYESRENLRFHLSRDLTQLSKSFEGHVIFESRQKLLNKAYRSMLQRLAHLKRIK